MPIISMRNITKKFPGTIALDNVDFSLEEGEIVSLLGENGAGKTTLMNVLYGIHQPDEGSIMFKGEDVSIENPTDAIDLGICMVHQHFMLAPNFSVIDNIIVGHEPKKGPFLDRKQAYDELYDLIEKYNFGLDLNTKVEKLSVGEQQRVEILKTLYRDARILILDEPTAVLTPNEVNNLFEILLRLRDNGVSIIIITHKLKETMSLADRVVVLRGGILICDDVIPAETNEQELANLMIGREIKTGVLQPSIKIGRTAYSVRNLSLTDNRGLPKLKNINFDIHKGEILGIAGVEGNGQTELLDVLTGQKQADTAEIILNGKKLSGNARYFIDNGVAYVPEDRTTMGLLLELPLTDNSILGQQEDFCSSLGIIDQDKVVEFTNKCIDQYSVVTPSCNATARALSGGNQQKLIMARALMNPSEILIVSQPVRGVDVSAAEYIHEQIFHYRNKGKPVLLVSADLDEVYQMSDRLIVIYDGEIVLEGKPSEYSKEEIGQYMLGVKRQEQRVIA